MTAPLSSNGRTPDFDSGNRGSSPCDGTDDRLSFNGRTPDSDSGNAGSSPASRTVSVSFEDDVTKVCATPSNREIAEERMAALGKPTTPAPDGYEWDLIHSDAAADLMRGAEMGKVVPGIAELMRVDPPRWTLVKTTPTEKARTKRNEKHRIRTRGPGKGGKGPLGEALFDLRMAMDSLLRGITKLEQINAATDKDTPRHRMRALLVDPGSDLGHASRALRGVMRRIGADEVEGEDE